MKNKQQSQALFADRILAGIPGVAIAAQADRYLNILGEYAEIVREDLKSAVVILADEVANFYYAHKEENQGRSPQVFPNLAIPFQNCFVEFPPHPSFDRPRGGCLFKTTEFKNRLDLEGMLQNHHAWKGLYLTWNESNSTHEDRFIHVEIDALLLSKHGGFSPVMAANLILSKNGGLAIKEICSRGLGWGDEYETDEGILQFYMGLVLPAALTFTFMNCRNVQTIENTPDAKFSRVWQKRHGVPLTKYYTLEIEPMKKVLEKEGGIASNGLKKALHICRGHFATYTPEKGMMGRKLESPVTVWKPAHTRGNSKYGEVKKDYCVKV